ncbi:MAG: 4-hydroxy-3-methylbut-2-enyl diphosphate reductase [Verrucomicrobiota bacterium]
MKLHLAAHYGMCFGVRDALRTAEQTAHREPATLLGPLVHNPTVTQNLAALGLREGDLHSLSSASTQRVLITAHGASDRDRQRWINAGHTLTDTTCPLVRKAHGALHQLVRQGFHPVVIGQSTHAEVRGLTGDFPDASIILEPGDIARIPPMPRIGIIAQTTQPLSRVEALVSRVRDALPHSEVRYVDTVCQPTKLRQEAVETLCKRCEVVIVVGGRVSNNTTQLAHRIRQCGATPRPVEFAHEIDPGWFSGVEHVGLTAGTSTPDETIRLVIDRLRSLGATLEDPLRDPSQPHPHPHPNP